MKQLKKYFEGFLALIALVVFLGLTQQINMWLVICMYWCILTVKNINDVVIRRKEGKDIESNQA